MTAKKDNTTTDKAAAKPSPQKADGGLSKNQRKILRAIAASKTPLTYGDVRTATGIQKGLSKLVAAEGKTHLYPIELRVQSDPHLVVVHFPQSNRDRFPGVSRSLPAHDGHGV